MTERELVLLEDADKQLDAMLEDGADRWGIAQAISYYEGLVKVLDRIAEQPLLYPQVSHIRAGYRRAVYQRHAIYFKLEENKVTVAAILKHQDITTHLPNAD